MPAQQSPARAGSSPALVRALPAPRASASRTAGTVLAGDSHLTPAYRLRRERALLALRCWTSASLGVSLDQLACSGVLLGYALRGFGLYLFESGAAKYWLIDAINAAADQFPEWRGFLRACLADR